MPSHKTHCAISKKRTGSNFSELHEWMDEPYKRLGKNHRTTRHTLNDDDMRVVRQRWGDKGVIEWLFHISLDNLDTAFKMSRNAYGENTFNYYQFGLEESGYIHLKFGKINNYDLKETFSEEDTIFDDSDESLLDMDLISVVKDVKKFVKGFSKRMEDFFK